MISLFKFLSFLVPLLVGVAYLTLVERKVLAALQRRRGPNVVGFWGLLQPLADGLKLFAKETIIPFNANSYIFLMAPLITFALSLINWIVIPLDKSWVLIDLNLGLLYLFSFSSLSIYGIVLSGWSSNSKYAFLGSLRASAQMISYEISIGIILLNVILCTGTLNLSKIVFLQEKIWYIVPLFPAALLFFFRFLRRPIVPLLICPKQKQNWWLDILLNIRR